MLYTAKHDALTYWLIHRPADPLRLHPHISPTTMADLHTCTHMRLPPELQAKADMLAIKENPANGHQITTAGTPQIGGKALSIALPIGSKWRNGSTLRVRILNGSGRIKTRIRQHATVWTEYANITSTSLTRATLRFVSTSTRAMLLHNFQ